MPKSKIFIGSSSEGLEVARAIQQNLENDAEITIWNQGVFQLSVTVIATLMKQLQSFDFAIFVFTPDDTLNFRNSEYSSVRDNVIFETGLFAGKLGFERVFFVKPKGKDNLHLPSDLFGLISGEYDSNRSDGNLVSGTANFCNQVRYNIQQLNINSIEGFWYDTSDKMEHVTLVSIRKNLDGYVVSGESFDTNKKVFLLTWSSIVSVFKDSILYTNYKQANYLSMNNLYETGILNLEFFGTPSDKYKGYYMDYSGTVKQTVRAIKISSSEISDFNQFKDADDRQKYMQMKMKQD